MTIRQHTFRAIGCTNSVLTTDATTIDEAARFTEAVVAELDQAASRFRADSEISRINMAASGESVNVVASELLGGCIAAALRAADITDGWWTRPSDRR
jgi:thiamine biosynthesis lipoprotein